MTGLNVTALRKIIELQHYEHCDEKKSGSLNSAIFIWRSNCSVKVYLLQVLQYLTESMGPSFFHAKFSSLLIPRVVAVGQKNEKSTSE